MAPSDLKKVENGISEEDQKLEGNIPEWTDFLVKPPDGGWGWMVVFASFMANFIVDGVSYSFGIFLPHVQRQYGSSQGKTALVGSLLTGVMSIVGPVASGLVNKFGSRPIMISGALISMTGLLMSVWVTTLPGLMVTYGLIGGIGFGLIYLPAIVHVGYYFEKRRSLATGIAVAGSGAGTFIVAPLSVALLNMFSWKGALWILAGLGLNCAVFGALLRPLEPEKNLKTLLDSLKELEEEEDEYGGIEHSQIDESFSNLGSVQSVSTRTPSRRTSSRLLLSPGGQSAQDIPKLSPRTHSAQSESSDQTAVLMEPKGSVPHLESVKEESEDSHAKAKQRVHAPARKRLESLRSYLQFPTRLRTVSHNEPSSRRRYSTRRTSLMVDMPATRYERSQSRISAKSYVSLIHRLWSEESPIPSKIQTSGISIADLDPKDLNRPLYRKDIFYSGSIQNIPEMSLVPTSDPSSPEAIGYFESAISIPHLIPADSVDAKSPLQRKGFSMNSVTLASKLAPAWIVLSEMIDVRLLKNPVMILLCLSNFFGMLGFFVPFVYLINRAENYGIHSGKASFLLSTIGITNTFGRVFFGWISDRRLVSSLTLSNVCLLSCGILTLMVPLFQTFATMAVYAAIFGFLISAFICLTSIILVDYMGLQQLTNSFGLLILARGLSAMVGSPLAGLVYDATNSYDHSFYFGGGLITIAALISFGIPLLNPSCPGEVRKRFQKSTKSSPDSKNATRSQ